MTRALPRPAPVPPHWPSVALTLGIALLGGLAARALHLPLPMLLGGLLAVAGVALTGWQPLGRPVQFPPRLRFFFIPILGVAIGASFTPAIMAEMRVWWPSLLVLCLFIPLAHYLSFRAVCALGRLDRVTVLFGTAPGGLIETVHMAEERGGDPAMVTVLQFLRVIVTLVTVPLFFTWLTGHAVGSAGGATLERTPFTLPDLPWLAGAALVGVALGRLTRLPAGFMTGPILCSGVVHLLGYVESAPPDVLVQATQLVIGASLGGRFAGIARRKLAEAAGLALVSTVVSLALAAAMALALAPLIHEPRTAVFLAFAPGGLAEMALIALSMQISIVYVTAHHALRIVLAVLAAKVLAKQTL